MADNGVPTQDVTSAAPDLKSRIFTGVNGLMSGSTGQDPSSSPLGGAIQAHQKRQLDEINMHRRTVATEKSAELMAHQGIDPDSGMRFDDPNYKGDDQNTVIARHAGNVQTAMQAYGKLAGMNPELKAAIAQHQAVLDHLTQQVAGGARPSTPAGAGSLPPPPGAGGAGAGASAAPDPFAGQSPSGAPASATAGGGSPLPPPPKSAPAAPAKGGKDSGPPQASGTADAQKKAVDNIGSSPSADMLAITAPALSQHIAQTQASARELKDFKDKNEILKQNRLEEIAATAKGKALYGSGQTPPRPVPLPTPITVLDARDLQEKAGNTFDDENGDPIDLSKVNDNMSLYGWRERIAEPIVGDDGKVTGYKQGWVTRYRPASPNTKTLMINGEQVGWNPGNVQRGVGAGSEIGPGKTGSTSSTTDPLGLTTTHTQTPKIGPSGAPPAGGASTPTGGGRQTTPNSPASTSPASSARNNLPPPPGSNAAAASAASSGKSADLAGQLNDDGQLPTKASYTDLKGRAIPAAVVEGANQLLDGHDLDKVDAKVRTLSAELARRAGWEQGRFTPKEQTNIRLAARYVNEFLNNKEALSALDDNFLQRMKLNASQHESDTLKGQAVTTGSAMLLNNNQAEFVRSRNQLLNVLSGLGQLSRGSRISDQTIKNLKMEIPSSIGSKDSADGIARLKRLKDEINTALEKGHFDAADADTTDKPVPSPKAGNNLPAKPASKGSQGGKSGTSAVRSIVL